MQEADILIDPFRPLVLERLGLAPTVLLKLNPRLIIARIVGFRRDGPMAERAGHDINYLAASGVLGLLGRAGSPPYAPSNLLADFGGGGMVALVGVLLALVNRGITGKGQVVEANMEDGVGYLGTMARLGRIGELGRADAAVSDGDGGSTAVESPPGQASEARTATTKVTMANQSNKAQSRGANIWSDSRGQNLLDGGCPYYDCYETKDGQYMAVGALEPKFFAQLIHGLVLPTEILTTREDRATWPHLRTLFTQTFKSKTRKQWEAVFEGKDACCTPVLSLEEMRKSGYVQRPMVTLRGSPGLAIVTGAGNEGKGLNGERSTVEAGQGDGVEGDGWTGKILEAGKGGEEVLKSWMGWKSGVDVDVVDGGWEKIEGRSRL